MLKKLTDYQNREIIHPKDIEYFSDYPAPLMELIHSAHFTNVNSTITFSPMLYFLARFLGVEQVLEIGFAECYTAFYLASAVKDNATRFGMKKNMYYGVDIAQCDKAIERLSSKDLPHVILNMDSINLCPETFKGITFDLVFQDGAHDTKHILHEFETLWPQLKGEGKGYWIAHDTYGPGEEGCRIIKEKIDNKEIEAEYVNIFCVYGLLIIRKMNSWDKDKRHWVA